MIPLLSDIERLIVEHASATVLKERLLLANDKFSAIEQKLVDAIVRIGQLESDNQTLQLNLDNARNQIGVLTKQIQEAQEKTASSDRCQTEHEILCFISDGKEHSTASISVSLKINEQLATHHLEKLLENEFVLSNAHGYGNYFWSLKPLGRSYLAERQLL